MSHLSSKYSKNPTNGNANGHCYGADYVEKLRSKNVRKHERQRRKRDLDLHESCCKFLKSAKLKQLSQPILDLGFSPQQATSALTANDGKVQESIAWLCDGNQDTGTSSKSESGGDLKLDITQELAKIEELETKYTCSKQDVEKAVIAFEGDLVKAEEDLSRKQKKSEKITPPPPLTVEEFTPDHTMQNKRNHGDDTPMATVTGFPAESVNKNQQFPVKINEANATAAPVVAPSAVVQMPPAAALVNSGPQKSDAPDHTMQNNRNHSDDTSTVTRFPESVNKDPTPVKEKRSWNDVASGAVQMAPAATAVVESGPQQSDALVNSEQQQNGAPSSVMMMQQAESSSSSSMMMGDNQDSISGMGSGYPNNNNNNSSNGTFNIDNTIAPLSAILKRHANSDTSYFSAPFPGMQYARPATSEPMPADNLGPFVPASSRPLVPDSSRPFEPASFPPLAPASSSGANLHHQFYRNGYNNTEEEHDMPDQQLQ